MINLEVIFWYIFLIDSIVYNGVAWFYVDWYKSAFPNVSGIIPINRIYGVLYIGLVTWVGSTLIRLGVLHYR